MPLKMPPSHVVGFDIAPGCYVLNFFLTHLNQNKFADAHEAVNHQVTKAADCLNQAVYLH